MKEIYQRFAISSLSAMIAFCFCLLANSDLLAQSPNQQMRYAVKGDSVFIYHIRPMQPGQGFNIYRKGEGEGTFIQLNSEVVQGITYASELPSAIGEDIYDQIERNLSTESVSDMYFKLRSNSVSGRLYTFVYPEVAQALGRLYIDSSVNIGETAVYRIEFVDDLGKPTGESITQEFKIDEHTPESPVNLRIENKGYRVTAEWEYAEMGNEDDKVIRFDLYSRDPGTDRIQLINDKVIIRETDKREYRHEFQANELGKAVEYFVTAVDITGQPGPPSERVTHLLKDDIAPSTVAEVKAEYVNGNVEITWPVSPEPDLKGYNIYKSKDIRQNYQKVNTQLVKPLQTFFQDSIVEEGNQYFYKVTAVDSAGNESPRSAAAMRHIADSNPPPTPTDVKIEFSEEETVSLNWNLSPRPVDLRRFIVLRSRIDKGNQQTFSQLTDRVFTKNSFEDIGEADKGFAEGAFYRYGILAADSSRNFSDTAFVEIQIPDLTPPEKPSFVRADNEDGIRVNVSWNATQSGDAVRYIVYREPLDSTLSEIRELPVSETSFRNENVLLGKKYRYGIAAVDSVGNESEATLSDTVWVRDYDPPRSVRNVKIKADESGEKGYQISWEPVVAPDLVGYKVYYSNISTGVYKPLTDVMKETSVIDSEGISGRWYQVVAVDISGNESRPSDPVKAE